MWPFNKFRIKFCHNPEMFCLRIVPSWFSSDYIHYKYTANGGLKWKYIHCACEPSYGLDYNWTWDRISHQFKPSSNFDYEKERWSSYQKILDYEAKQWEIFTEGDKKHRQERDDYYRRKNEKLKELNQC
jgi:hypothetical protein